MTLTRSLSTLTSSLLTLTRSLLTLIRSLLTLTRSLREAESVPSGVNERGGLGTVTT